MTYTFICKFCKREFVYPNDNRDFEYHTCNPVMEVMDRNDLEAFNR